MSPPYPPSRTIRVLLGRDPQAKRELCHKNRDRDVFDDVKPGAVLGPQVGNGPQDQRSGVDDDDRKEAGFN
jgi:hypothetical protein